MRSDLAQKKNKILAVQQCGENKLLAAREQAVNLTRDSHFGCKHERHSNGKSNTIISQNVDNSPDPLFTSSSYNSSRGRLVTQTQ